MKDIKDMPVTFFFLAVVAAPVLEEIMFRGIILEGYLKNYKPWTAILVSAFIFGLIHGNLAQGVNAFALGILFGWIYWKTSSILLVILLHFVNNVLAFVSSLYTPLEDIDKSSRQLIDNDILYACLYLISVGVCVWLLTLMQKKYFQTPISPLAAMEESVTTPEA
jgi:membrane protease YdiL (CAAX protease family)